MSTFAKFRIAEFAVEGMLTSVSAHTAPQLEVPQEAYVDVEHWQLIIASPDSCDRQCVIGHAKSLMT
jgi:hypothetical protein